MGERFIVKVRTNGQKHGFCQADIHFNFGITPRQLCNLGYVLNISGPWFPLGKGESLLDADVIRMK